jgi:hypothetical protein
LLDRRANDSSNGVVENIAEKSGAFEDGAGANGNGASGDGQSSPRSFLTKAGWQ